MEFSPTLLAVPLFLAAIIVEWLTNKTRTTTFNFRDSLSNLGCGIGSESIGWILTPITVGIYSQVYSHWGITWTHSPLVLGFVAFVGVDFCYYWLHRKGHEWALLWAFHSVHHQSEYYNLTVALRQSWFGGILGFVFYLPLALLGIPTEYFALSLALNLIYQFFIHTESVRSMGILEFVLNTPSHHRVHHGRNRLYLDKNYGGVLIIWDRLFGSFEKEREPVDYGLTSPFLDSSVWRANVQPLTGLLQMAIRAPEKIFRPPGWERGDKSAKDAQSRLPSIDRNKTVPFHWNSQYRRELLLFLVIVGSYSTLGVFQGHWPWQWIAGSTAVVLTALACLDWLMRASK